MPTKKDRSEYLAAYRLSNCEKRNAYFKKYYAANKEKCNLATAAWSDLNLEKRVLIRAKSRAKGLGLDFNLDLTDIYIPDVCPYLGVKLARGRGKGRSPFDVSLDRVDSSKGYVKGNVQIISRLANTMKNNSTLIQLITFAEGVLKLHKKEGVQ